MIRKKVFRIFRIFLISFFEDDEQVPTTANQRQRENDMDSYMLELQYESDSAPQNHSTTAIRESPMGKPMKESLPEQVYDTPP